MSDEKPSLLSKLLSNGGDASVKLITLALVVVTGGGNFFATKQAASINEQEAQRAVKEIHELHSAITDALDRQKWLQSELVTATERQKRMEDMLIKLSK